MRNLLNMFTKKKSASIAKERLKLRIEHERSVRNQPDWFPKLQAELLEVIAKYTDADEKDFQINMTRDNDSSIIEINIPIENN